MDGVDGVVERAGGDPVAAREEVLLAARRLAVPELPEFFEAACRRFRTAGHVEPAAAMFGLARQVEETHERMLALPIDHDRVREVFVELAADGVITPAVLHDYVKRQATRLDRDAARADARAVAGAFFDAGTVPYPNVLAELIALAPDSARRDEETDHLTERLLRAGLLAAAALPVWETVLPALPRMIRQAPELLDLLVAAEPAAGVYADPELAGRVRGLWLDALDRARADARLPRSWFLGLGPAPAGSLLSLADQAGERLFPTGHGAAPADDPALAVPSDPDPLAFRNLSDRDKRDEKGSGWYAQDPATLPELRRTDPAAFERAMDAFVRHLGHYSNVDYPRGTARGTGGADRRGGAGRAGRRVDRRGRRRRPERARGRAAPSGAAGRGGILRRRRPVRRRPGGRAAARAPFGDPRGAAVPRVHPARQQGVLRVDRPAR